MRSVTKKNIHQEKFETAPSRKMMKNATYQNFTISFTEKAIQRKMTTKNQPQKYNTFQNCSANFTKRTSQSQQHDFILLILFCHWLDSTWNSLSQSGLFNKNVADPPRIKQARMLNKPETELFYLNFWP